MLWAQRVLASDYDLETPARLIDLANAVPDHLKLGDIGSEQVRALMLYMSEAVNARGWGLDWKNPRAWRHEPGR